MSEKLKLYPAVILRGITILPYVVAHFDIRSDRDIHSIEQAMVGEQKVFLISQSDVETESPSVEELYSIGVVAVVKQVIKMQPGIVRVLVEGLHRAHLDFLETGGNYDIAEVSFEDDKTPEDHRKVEAMLWALKDTMDKYAAVSGKEREEYKRAFLSLKDPWKIIYTAANYFPLHYDQKQEVLDAETLDEAYEALVAILLKEIEVAHVKSDFESKVRERVDKNQRDYLLREQLRVIREELGDDPGDSEIDNFKKQTEEIDAPDKVKEKILKEISRFEKLSSGSSESAVSRGYIETLLELPWNRMSEDREDLKNAKKVLDEHHYGMEKVKERILEFLAVRILTSKGDTPIICLVGPPGTGKTSIARSVAEALNKKFVRIHLGGVRDEAEIRGHRRTYVGAMPGRIAVGLKNAGVKNPLMLLDEIDKVSNDFKGDTFSALLEVLDPDQNERFSDHYVEIPIDLSEVFFIATANTVQTIPRPLLDRMEIIEVSGYTENEKVHIATEHLMRKQYEKNGLKPSHVKINKPALSAIIRNYTREAGVRDLERRIGEICRKSARKILEDKEKKILVNTVNLSEFLGKVKYPGDRHKKKDAVGLMCGLAWTSVGGDTLEIEVNVMPGKGELLLTGKLGDVMKESARAGISYIRSGLLKKAGVEEDFFSRNDIHIHIPEGAVPKDGPSAGITMATALYSAVSGKELRSDTAMTGEITLRGRVLAVGGLKEKLLAAKNAGIRQVLVPADNEPDIAELSDEITGSLDIVYVSTMEEVLNHALSEKKR